MDWRNIENGMLDYSEYEDYGGYDDEPFAIYDPDD